ncbi:hypothetical protein AX16_006525 [Volvariella volvacea WC 439]|nr:hypothetical protein AX16_006525 [Volvariella volvacea WC 439]
MSYRSPPFYSSIGRSGGNSSGSGGNCSNGQLIMRSERQTILYQQQQQQYGNFEQGTPNKRGRKVIYAILFLILLISWFTYRQSVDITDPAVRDRIRKEWEQEVQNHQREVARMDRETEDMRQLRESWERQRQHWSQERDAQERERARERQEWEMERQRQKQEWERETARRRQNWERERQEHEEEDREWQRRNDEIKRKEREWKEREEREEKRKHALHWDEIRPDDQCLQYRTRRYTANLSVPYGWDGHKYCLTTPIEILGIIRTEPMWCEEVSRGRWRGHWDIHDEPDCSTYFENYQDKGCTGPESRLHRYEAHMGNLLDGDDWRAMCSTTPANLMGREYSSPHHCANWGKYGTWGIWFVDDPQC